MAFRRTFNRSSFPVGRAVRRKVLWFGTAEAAVDWTAVAGSAKLLVLTTNIADPVTIVRNRGLLGVRSDQSVATEDQIGAWGMAVVTADAANAGAASLPGPMTDSSFPWLMFEPFAQSFVFKSGIGVYPSFGDMRLVDSRAMRKITEGQSLVLMYESGVNSAGVDVLANMRTLLKVA